jgi:hypothetical protein
MRQVTPVSTLYHPVVEDAAVVVLEGTTFQLWFVPFNEEKITGSSHQVGTEELAILRAKNTEVKGTLLLITTLLNMPQYLRTNIYIITTI